MRIFVQCKRLQVADCRLLGKSICHRGPARNVQNSDAIQNKKVRTPRAALLHWIAAVRCASLAMTKTTIALCPVLFTMCIGTGSVFAADAGAGATGPSTAEFTNFSCDAQFCVKTTELAADTTFNFTMSAKGSFTVDWGDGSAIQTITRGDTTNTTYSHTYTTAGTYVIKYNGTATGYSTSSLTPAIRFTSNKLVGQIEGSLGSIFPTISPSTTNGNQPRFYQTFYNCTNMTGSIPSGLFNGISGQPASYMFSNTFSGCSGLTGSIPDGLFSGISGAPASSMFDSTFRNCSGLTGSIPDGLFSGISGAPASQMFYSTFQNCSGLTGSIPDGLFSGISGAPASQMFYSTFQNCSGLTGSIPDGLFGHLSGAPASGMFMQTFYGCSNLTGSIPDGLFSGISGAPASSMFFNTFYGCSGLSGSIPDGLFSGISGAPASSMFFSTFHGCSGLSGYVPSSMYSGITSVSNGAMSYVFSGSGLATTCPSGMEQVTTGWESQWSSKVACATPAEQPVVPVYTNFDCGTNKFCVKTTELAADTTFSFSMSAKGNFTVDWGDGSAVQTINRTNTTSTTYSHTYTTAGTYIIKFNGTATAYNTDTGVSAIGFRDNSRVKQIEGSLGALFPTIQSTQNPGFRYAFAGCTSLVGSIPDNLFNGITGQPRAWMFANLFQDCTNLSGEIPETLFQGINGAPKVGTFSSTFKNCSSLTGEIPENLFSGISGSPQNYVFADTFYNCQNLSGQIPEGLFSGLNGAPAQWMFRDTFFNCIRLNGNIPNNLFGNIQGAANTGMFVRTFKNCSNLTGYVPSSIYSGITNVNTDGMKEVFYGTNLATSCPTQQIITGWESQWNDKVACEYTNPSCDAQFCVETIELTANTTFNFTMSAKGSFTVDWGDGSAIQTITRGDTTNTTYSHTYTTAGTYVIKYNGTATGYSINSNTAAIGFTSNTLVGQIEGSLGSIFPTISPSTTNGNQPRFYQTFYNCTNMTGSIPSGLFDGISGAPAVGMFNETFSGCRGLTGSIPANLFSGISGAPANGMFESTFQDCSNLSGSIPTNLFAGISGAPANGMFNETFSGCRGLTGYVPNSIYSGITSVNSNGMLDVFAGTNLATSCPTQQIITGWESQWSGKVACEYTNFPCDAQFCVKTTQMAANTAFNFIMSAKGNFTVDWGDGSAIQTITRTDTTGTTYSHTYTTAGTYVIKFNGTATGYGTSGAAISFTSNTLVGQIEGSLGALFPTISPSTTNGNQPRFYKTFYNCTNMTGSIPPGLFSGISGAPTGEMFYSTFQDCSNLSGSIPAGLFSGISGAPTYNMFQSTFRGCSNLTGSIPASLFAGISGAPAASMFYSTFRDCSNLTGSIPETLFSGISGAAGVQMFYATFQGCSKLTGYVPSSIYSGITNVNLDTSWDSMVDVFAGTGLATTCPDDMQQITTGWESQWSSKVACGSWCTTGYGKTDSGECQQLCSAGITAMHVNTSMFNVYANKQTERALHVKYNNQMCYVSAATGVGTNTLHIRDINGDVYHLIN